MEKSEKELSDALKKRTKKQKAVADAMDSGDSKARIDANKKQKDDKK